MLVAFLRTMTFLLLFIAMPHPGTMYANCGCDDCKKNENQHEEKGHKKHKDKKHHKNRCEKKEKHKCHECHEEEKCCPKACEVRRFEERGLGFMNAIINNMNAVFATQGLLRVSGADANSQTNPNLAALIQAETGTNIGGTGQYILQLGMIFTRLGVSEENVVRNRTAFEHFVAAGINYSNIVATMPFDSNAQAAAALAWSVAGINLGASLVELCFLSCHDDINAVQGGIAETVTSLGQSVLGYNTLANLNALTAVATFDHARKKIFESGSVVFNCLLNKRCLDDEHRRTIE